MSAPHQAPLLGMRLFEARRILKHPVFGDPRCIEAHNLLLLAIELADARAAMCHSSGLSPLRTMTGEELREELQFWCGRGYEPEIEL